MKPDSGKTQRLWALTSPAAVVPVKLRFCLIIFGGIVLMPRVISSTVALAIFLQHEHHLREAADYIPIDQLGTTDDCGFVPSVGPAAFFRQRLDRRREEQELPARPP